MNRRIFALMTACCMFLTGCQLAQETSDGKENAQITDQIVGILVTVESGEGPHDEGALHTFASVGRKLYAQLNQSTYKQADGTEGTTQEYAFPDGNGIVYMVYYVHPEQTGSEEPDSGYWSSTIDKEIDPRLRHFKTVNETSAVELEGTIYVEESAKDLALYMNPVYQTPEGEVYALGTAPMGYLAATMDGCSARYSMSVREKENGEIVQSSEGYVEMAISVIDLPDKYVVIQMDREHRMLGSSEYTPEKMPEEIIPEEACAYLILECHNSDGTVELSVYSPEDGYALDTFYPLDNGICVKGYTVIRWEDTE